MPLYFDRNRSKSSRLYSLRYTRSYVRAFLGAVSACIALATLDVHVILAGISEPTIAMLNLYGLEKPAIA